MCLMIREIQSLCQKVTWVIPNSSKTHLICVFFFMLIIKKIKLH